MSKYIKEELEQLIFEDNLSYEEIGRRYGCTGANIKKQAKKLGIELPKRRTINNNEHFNKNKNARYCLVCGKQLPSENKKYCSYILLDMVMVILLKQFAWKTTLE